MDQNKRLIQIVIGIGILLIVLIAFGSSLFVRIEPGHRGVLFKTLSGNLVDRPYEQGWHVKAPWDKFYIYDVRQHEKKESMTVLSSNGLDIKLDISIRFHPNAHELADLHDKIGKNYVKTVVIPEVRSSTREVIGQYKPEELYATKRGKIQSSIEDMTRKAFERNYLALQAIPVRAIILPDKIKQAIERKLSAEQKIQEKEYEKQQAKKEAERRKIEAQGKADANRILSKSLTNEVLRDKGIDATTQLAESENSKVIVIGSGDGGLPLILNSSK